jgi:6-pyruvoyltetrahydropterin/6-carboxytetrahydropterin synthase
MDSYDTFERPENRRGVGGRAPVIRLTREVRTSLGEAGAEIGDGWSGSPRPTPESAFLVLRATVQGEPDPVTGYLCDIKILDRRVRDAVQSAIRDVRHARAWPTYEAVAQAAWRRLADRAPPGVAWDRLELLASPYIRCELRREAPSMIRITEQFEFSAAHRLHCKQFSDDENRRLFGKCNNPHGHGHNYLLEVTVEAEPDPATGAVAPLGLIGRVVDERVLRRFDHKHLNVEVEEFRDCNPSVENIARTVWSLLEGAFAPATLVNVRVYETAKTWADCSGGGS